MRNALIVLAIVATSLLGLYCMDETRSGGLGKNWFGYHQDGRPDLVFAEGVKLYHKPEDPYKQEYPQLFASEAVIVIFGADWCQWCKAQAKELTQPSESFNIVYWEIETDGEPNKYAALIEKWGIRGGIPVTALVSQGKVIKTWKGYTPWSEIESFSGKAKKNEHESAPDFIIGPIDPSRGNGAPDLDDHERNKRKR